MTADEIRAAMSVDPELLCLADVLREKFGARLIWLKTADIEVGRPPIEPTNTAVAQTWQNAPDRAELNATGVPYAVLIGAGG